ncbi:Ferredoxin, 2Fe-2S [Gulosibacter sp. 10]|nr:2Fe-2S iron-sulfur cluster-binding protein [Gulosibacter sp. 10]SJM63382.1 Ferredoxin, 2Fe-2S [Gulosibacter sp. 10]
MPRIVYIGSEDRREIDAEEGQSVMRAAILNGVDGIVGECGGQAMCATCHVFVERVEGELPEIGEDEDEMLDCTADPRRENSRLGCQLSAGEDFAELEVRLPSSQV